MNVEYLLHFLFRSENQFGISDDKATPLLTGRDILMAQI